MKNITVSVADAVHQRARIRAAERGTSLSALVRDYLESLSAHGSDGEERLAQQNALFAKLDAEARGLSAADRLSREQLHARS